MSKYHIKADGRAFKDGVECSLKLKDGQWYKLVVVDYQQLGSVCGTMCDLRDTTKHPMCQALPDTSCLNALGACWKRMKR